MINFFSLGNMYGKYNQKYLAPKRQLSVERTIENLGRFV